MTEKYKLLVYYVHSCLESVRNELKISKYTTVDNFRDQPENEIYCEKIFQNSLSQWGYELSWGQMANGIDLFLKAYNTINKEGKNE